MIRTRIAPSPTGRLHIGTARTALFNYLYAKNQGGEFILRIEDTDTGRSTQEFEQSIVEGLTWLGLIPDEGVTLEGSKGLSGPYRQSERTHLYRPYLEQLIQSGHVYWCPTDQEELSKLKQETEAMHQALVYRPDHRDGRYSYQEGSVLRFRVPDEIITFEDKIKGTIQFDTSLMGDFVIAKGFDTPLYNFVVVVDDELMHISHIIRGEDHISNTPKQILLNRALGFGRKTFAHLPLILASDRSKMSKRHGATDIAHYRERGYLPEAMINFLALLGWNEGNNREFYTEVELIKAFSLKRVQKSGAIFNQEKLDSINARYIKALPRDRKITLGMEFLHKKNIILGNLTQEQKEDMILLECDRIKRFDQIGDEVTFLWEEPEYPVEMLAWRDMSLAKVRANLEWVRSLIYNKEEQDFKHLEHIIKTAIKDTNTSMGEVLWPFRVCLSGKAQSPSPFEIAAILGKSTTLYRLTHTIERLS